MAYKIKRKVMADYIPLSDKLEKQLDRQSIAYELGFNKGKTGKRSINYDEEMHTPINSFSEPKSMSKEYEEGWKAGRSYLLEKENTPIQTEKPFKIVNRSDTESSSLEVWQLPKSKYAIQYLDNEKGDKRWRVMEVYVTKEGEVRTRGDLPYKDYSSYLEALDHIEYNAKIEKENS